MFAQGQGFLLLFKERCVAGAGLLLSKPLDLSQCRSQKKTLSSCNEIIVTTGGKCRDKHC